MKEKIYTFCLLSLLYFSSCGSEDMLKPDHPPKSGTYITSYLTVLDSVETEQVENNKLPFVKLNLLGKYTTYNSPSFWIIANYYNDIGYKDSSLPTNISVLSDSITSIHFYTLKHFNETYKKNDKIDNIVKIKYTCFFEFVESNYQNTSQIENYINLIDFNLKPTKLFMTGFFIQLQEKPSESGIYPIQIEIVTSSNLVKSKFELIHIES